MLGTFELGLRTNISKKLGVLLGNVLTSCIKGKKGKANTRLVLGTTQTRLREY